MAKLAKNFIAHERTPKKISQAGRRNKCKLSSMNKSKKRSLKFKVGQGK